MRELELRDAARAAREAGAREAEFLQLAELVKHQRNKFVHLVHLAGQHAAELHIKVTLVPAVLHSGQCTAAHAPAPPCLCTCGRLAGQHAAEPHSKVAAKSCATRTLAQEVLAQLAEHPFHTFEHPVHLDGRHASKLPSSVAFPASTQVVWHIMGLLTGSKHWRNKLMRLVRLAGQKVAELHCKRCLSAPPLDSPRW